MGRKANPALIGAFVVGAIALAVGGLLVFGSGQWFKSTSRFVCFFPGAVDGLNVGAPVKFKGVEIGSVVDIRLRLDMQPEADPMQPTTIRIPVVIELDNEKLSRRGAKRMRDPGRMQEIVGQGLRAQLNAQSLVTGLLFVQLDFKPDLPAVFVLPPDSNLPELPTIPTSFEQVQSAAVEILHKIEDLHIENLVQAATETVEGVRAIVQSPELKASLEQLPTTVASINKAVNTLRDVAANFDANQAPLLKSLRETSERTGEALEQARATLQSVQALTAPNAPIAAQLTASLQEVSTAARSVRLLADYLERNPGALVRGKEEVNPK